MVHITKHGCSAQLHPQLVDAREMDASQVLLSRKYIKTHAGTMCSLAGMHTHAGARAHMRQLQTHRAETNTCSSLICIHCARAQNTDDNHGHLRVINDILIASLPGSSPTGRPHAGRDALRHPAMLLICCSSSRLWSSFAFQVARRELRKSGAVWASCTVN